MATDTTSAALTYEQVIASWNAQADQYNQWDALGEDEKIEWAVACANQAPQTHTAQQCGAEVRHPPKWIDPNDKTQAQYLPHIGERILFKHAGKVYIGKHCGGSFRAEFPLGKHFDTWSCVWMYPVMLDAARSQAKEGRAASCQMGRPT